MLKKLRIQIEAVIDPDTDIEEVYEFISLLGQDPDRPVIIGKVEVIDDGMMSREEWNGDKRE